MRVVIDISEDSYKATCSGSMLPPDVKNVVNAIKNGTVLPKGHGDLIDRNAALAEFDKADLSKKEMIGKLVVFGTPTVIPADK